MGRIEKKNYLKLNSVNAIWFAARAIKLDEDDFNDNSILIGKILSLFSVRNDRLNDPFDPFRFDFFENWDIFYLVTFNSLWNRRNNTKIQSKHKNLKWQI